MDALEILGPANAGKLHVESLPFDRIPDQSKLFLDYLSDPLSLSQFYPTAVSNHRQVVDRVPEVLDRYAVDREALADILQRQNLGFGAKDATLRNIEELRSTDCVAVVTGQQAGLFGGPLYTVFKALSAIRMAACLNERGQKAVPVFWAATEDHDLEEIASTEILTSAGTIASVGELKPEMRTGAPVGMIELGTSVTDSVDKVFQLAPAGPFTGEMRRSLERAYHAESSYGTAFARLMADLFAEYGLVILDPLDRDIKRLSSPLYSLAVERSKAMVDSLKVRDNELKVAGYHSQVLIESGYFPFFWISDEGIRLSIKRDGEGYSIKGTSTRFSLDELSAVAKDEPWRLSPGVMLRPVDQDHLLPTVCYFGGGAEIAYFAQNSVVYETLERPVTPIMHRQSFTICEPKHKRTLDRYELHFDDLFVGIEKLSGKIVAKDHRPETARLFAEAEENINLELNRLDQDLAGFDPTLSEALSTRRRKILYHIAAMYKKFQKASVEQDKVFKRRIETLFAALYPNNALQERSINAVVFLNLYGPEFLRTVYRNVDLDDTAHRIIYI